MSYRDDYLEGRKSDNGAWCYCEICGKAVRKSECDVDHIIPQSHRMTSDESWNLRITCPSCNRRRKDQASVSDYGRAIKRRIFG